MLIVLAALCAFAVKIAIAYNTYGTNDAITFEADIAKVEGEGPKALYRDGVEPEPGHKQPFSHSPPLIHVLLLMKRLERASGLPVRFWLRFCCAWADLASLVLLWKLGVRSIAALLMTALSPVSLMISGFHVNTDPVVVFAVLWSVYLADSRRFAWAGVALGAALSVKLTALLFVPALFVAVGVRRSVTIGGVALAWFCVFSLPFIVEFPATIGASVSGYIGSGRIWGIHAASVIVGAHGAEMWYDKFGKIVALGAVGISALIVRYKGRQNAVLNNCGLSAAFFLVLTPRFGVQYLAYLVPWLAVAPPLVRAGFHAVSGVFLAAFYTWGSRGFPWYSANFFTARFMPPHVFFLGLATWVVTGAVAWKLARTAGGTPAP